MNWFRKTNSSSLSHLDATAPILYDEKTFYNKFTQDLLWANEEVVIESPFLTTRRVHILKPVFEKLVQKGVEVFVLTRHPREHDYEMAAQAETCIRYFEVIGVQVLLCNGGYHRKLAMIDRKVHWEGNLNILSQSYSREFMRRIDNKRLAEEMFVFLNYKRIFNGNS